MRLSDKAIERFEVIQKALSDLADSLYHNGWKKTSTGESRDIEFNYRFDLYMRRRKFIDIIPNVTTKHPNQKPVTKDEMESRFGDKMESNFGAVFESAPTTKFSENSQTLENTGFPGSKKMESFPSMGLPKGGMTPNWERFVREGERGLPELSGFMKYESLRAIRMDASSLTIGFDSEWFYPDGESGDRLVLSWQYSAFIQDELWEFVFLRKLPNYELPFSLALGRILDIIGIKPIDIRKVKKYVSLGSTVPQSEKRLETVFDTYKEAYEASCEPFPDGSAVHTKLVWVSSETIPVTLVCHAGKADVSALKTGDVAHKDLLRYCSEVQGGLVTLHPVRIHVDSYEPVYAQSHHPHKFQVELQIADTLCHAPGKKRTLAAIGDAIHWEKLGLPDGFINNMDKLLVQDAGMYFEYASNDAVIALLYASTVYGYNRRMPITITSAAAKVVKHYLMLDLGCSTTSEFNRKYRGLEKVSHGMVPREDRPGYVESSSLEPISNKANTIQQFASKAYIGGYNSSSEIGYFPKKTYDYDLRNAYPTAMCLVADVDWEIGYTTVIRERYLSLRDFRATTIGGMDLIQPFFAYIQFEFPENILYPCIPVRIDGIPVYLQSSKGLPGVYASGPEIYLALRLGAKVYCEEGYLPDLLWDEETGAVSFSMREGVKRLVQDRETAKKIEGKGSIVELILKALVNAIYGKSGQNVITKHTWSAMLDEMESLGCSSITNPVSACMTTSIIRATLLAAQNQCSQNGYMACSVTTDGFITDCPEEELKLYDLYGFRYCLENARLFFSDGDDINIWEVKHSQDDLLNFCTRGNVSLSPGGVCAHNSSKSGFKPDSIEDRIWLMKAVASRCGPVQYMDRDWTSFKDLVHGEPFAVKDVIRKVRMDFDMKRKPDRSSFFEQNVTVDGESFPVATFSTVPFGDAAEYRAYRDKKKLVTCLRTLEDWSKFWCKIDAMGSKAKVRDKEWSILNSCIMGHRAGLWNIPALDQLKGQKRNEWINEHNESGKLWTDNDWKNAGKKNRHSNILPFEMLSRKLQELGAAVVEPPSVRPGKR